MFGRKKKPEDNSEPNGPVNHNNVNPDGAKKQVAPSAQAAVPAAAPAAGPVPHAHALAPAQQASASNLNAASSSTAGRHPNQLAKSMDKMKIGSEENKQQSERPASAEPKANDADKKKTKPSISYAAERVIGSGSFGVVYQATIIETGETVAIKKVLQDRRFKNRELQIMRLLDHPCVVKLKNSFLAKGDKPDEVFLNLVMEFISETIHRTLRNHTKAKKLIPIMYTKVYMFQVCRSLAYIHSQGICHRDIKPQNLLLDPNTHAVKLCDFGSAKVLQKGQSNVAYICSRYYRAPELVFEATEYTNAIDIWSLGCVMGELLIGKPIFPGDSSVDQLIEIIKILGTPTREEIFAMNPNHTSFSFPQIAAQPWARFFRDKAPPDAIDLISRFLIYKPLERLDPLKALAHEFFDDLRKPDARLPNGKPLPSSVFNFTQGELKQLATLQLTEQVIPPHVLRDLQIHQPSPPPPHDESKVDP